MVLHCIYDASELNVSVFTFLPTILLKNTQLCEMFGSPTCASEETICFRRNASPTDRIASPHDRIASPSQRIESPDKRIESLDKRNAPPDKRIESLDGRMRSNDRLMTSLNCRVKSLNEQSHSRAKKITILNRKILADFIKANIFICEFG
jgi:hypothetical protein